VLASLGVTAAATAQPGPAPKPPKLEIDRDTIELGEVTRSQKPIAAFEIRNVGGDTLKILKVKPG